MTKIILDIIMENLLDILSGKWWNVITVTKELGSSTETRVDKNILDYALKNPDVVVVTIDKPFVSRMKSAGVKVVALAMEDKARIIDEKLISL